MEQKVVKESPVLCYLVPDSLPTPLGPKCFLSIIILHTVDTLMSLFKLRDATAIVFTVQYRHGLEGRECTEATDSSCLAKNQPESYLP